MWFYMNRGFFWTISQNLALQNVNLTRLMYLLIYIGTFKEPELNFLHSKLCKNIVLDIISLFVSIRSDLMFSRCWTTCFSLRLFYSYWVPVYMTSYDYKLKQFLIQLMLAKRTGFVYIVLLLFISPYFY